MVTSTKPKHGRRGDDTTFVDRGCFVAARCTECPLTTCILEAPASELVAFRSAWRTIARYVAAPDGTIA
jgi:hypothetical protein